MSERGRGRYTLGYGRDEDEAWLDRQEQIMLARRGGPTTSTVPSRCASCREWGKATSLGNCVHCRGPFR